MPLALVHPTQQPKLLHQRLMIWQVTSKYASARTDMSIAFIFPTAPFVDHSRPTHVPSWVKN